jgi:hypothetical protein
MSSPWGLENAQRVTAPPDQDSRLDRDPHHVGRPRRARAWIAVAIGVLVIAAFVAIVATGAGVNSNEPDDGYVVDTP